MKKLIVAVLFVASITLAKRKSAFVNPNRIDHIDLDTRKRPVVGILTEPLRGEVLNSDATESHYIPKTHVQFLEQAGVRVIPIDFRLSREQRYELYDQLNGVYLPGDSHMTAINELYKDAFFDTLMYQEEQLKEKEEHFPLFLMGNSLQHLVRARQSSGHHLSDIKPMRHQSYELRLVEAPAESFLFHSMTQNEEQAVFNKGLMFNKEVTGLKIKNLMRDAALHKKFRPLAVFDTGAVGDQQVIAIAEGIKVPLYVFAYGVELIQFYFENSTENLDDHQLDHSIIARTHAQYIAGLIADEARLSTHSFQDEEQVFERLARHNKLATVSYQSDRSDRESLLPPGMRSHEVYLLF